MNFTDSYSRLERGHAAFRGPPGGRSDALPSRAVISRGDVDPAPNSPAPRGEAERRGPGARLGRFLADGIRVGLTVLVLMVLLAHATSSLTGFVTGAIEAVPRARGRDRRVEALGVDVRTLDHAAGNPQFETACGDPGRRRVEATESLESHLVLVRGSHPPSDAADDIP